MAKNRKIVPGPFIVVNDAGEPLRDERGAIREFSTEKRAAAAVGPGHRVALGKR
ncbi:hypothetical protein [Sphingomonas aerophila]|uniref:Uncharacterized protein n=1 Tax=Sphingomonas aerophila TaxID=1344948 RepID=A0A7W9BFK7_9SPHN|nr:hypothetical protein [Sphingomonas aerophila]MBB5716266.1 hypothetical protein [Sphingomonas aerophila]